MFHRNTIYLVGEAKAASNNPIMEKFSCFFIGFVIDRDSHEIVDVECSTVLSLTSRFIHSMLAGQSILSIEELEEEIQRRYLGSSQKALIVALRNASMKYRQLNKL
ncbi:DUF3870 domain-containing protein [Peribacillus sp. SI8-4]|uniref:DUF3870 domain-containing protein n=1 Tax=Peribacillus sp. SI8-4 TaxID=3048009 RepID=UPI0025523B85|nr:DUF3870 domain-containing protein [Peribacillus sp. SI8-4]